jgi:2-C-methyl-D-erythritol 4-phosphate cytidylyltransferase
VADSVAALIPAAGSGERLGRGPKAFVGLAGRPLVAWAAAALEPYVDDLIVAVPEVDLERAAALLPAACIVVGGVSRQATVARLLEATASRWVLVHDAARPFLSAKVIGAMIAAVRRHGAATAAIPVVDTLFEVEAATTIDRSALRAIQTPQGFERSLLIEAHRRAGDGVGATDDAELVRRLGREVALVPGSAWLHKITTPDDLELAEAMAAGWRG